MMEPSPEWDADIWRLRFRAYTPLELVKWVHRDNNSYVDRIALEVLDEKLIAMGCVPTRHE